MATIIVPLVALLIAALVVAALWLWWTGDQPEAATAEGGETNITAFTSVDIAQNVPATIATPAPAPVVGTPSAGIEILRVARDRNGELNVTVSGVTYRNMSEFEDNPLMREDFLSTLGALAQFAQTTENVSAPMTSIPAPTPAPVISAPVHTEAPKPAPSKKSATPAKTLEEEAAAQEAERNSMAGQIETLLQARLLKTEGMADRSIHIHSAPSGGVEINVDGLLYDSVSDITDAAARSVIEAAIRDWEAAHPM